MAEELRLFLRSALYASAIGLVYWFVSYEIAGTFMLGFVALAGAAFVAIAATTVKATVADLDTERLRRLVAFEQHDGVTHESPLELEEAPFPPTSAWPALAAAAALLVGLGAVFGPWFYLPGLTVGLISLYGWLTQLTPR